MTPSLNSKLHDHYPIIDLLYDLEVAKEREQAGQLSGYILPDDTIGEIKKELLIYNN